MNKAELHVHCCPNPPKFAFENVGLFIILDVAKSFKMTYNLILCNNRVNCSCCCSCSQSQLQFSCRLCFIIGYGITKITFIKFVMNVVASEENYVKNASFTKR